MKFEEWPFRVELQPDELLSSFLIRNAHAHGTSPYLFMNYFWPGRALWDRDCDRSADREWLSEVSELAGVPTEVLATSTLIPFRQSLGSTSRYGDTSLLLSASVYHRTRRRHGLQFCPECLSNHPYWFRRIWRLGFVLYCPEHGIPLIDCCPACGSPVIPHRSLRLDARYCHQCDSCLHNTMTENSCSERLLDLQKLLLNNLLTPSTTEHIGPFHGTVLFAAIRSLLSVLTVRISYAAIRDAFNLPETAWLPHDRLQFEHARWPERLLLLELLSVWISDWPASFHLGAEAAGLSQKTFARLRQPKGLREEIQRLKPGSSRNRRYEPKVFDEELLRLKRIDRKAYRKLRAKRLLALALLK